jgi:uncharacterized membrane protein
MTKHHDRLVTEYLAQVEQATADLPPQRRGELLQDLREHIDTARAELPAETETQLRGILDRLGEPETIAAAAGIPTPADAPPITKSRNRRRIGAIVMIATAVVAIIIAICVLGFFSTRDGGDRAAGSVPTWTVTSEG